MAILVLVDELNVVTKLNCAQRQAFDTIKHATMGRQSAIFIIDDPGGTRKTFLYRTLLANVRNDGLIILLVVTSGIASLQLRGGRTTHSKFKLPICLDSDSRCSFSKQSELCQLIEQASGIVWDETPMADKKAIEMVDRTLRKTLEVNLPFGCKVIVLGGDFHQVVPIVVGGTREQIVRASILEFCLWPSVKVLHLEDNVRDENDPRFSEFLFRVGNGEEPIVQDNMIRIPDSMVVPWEGEHSIDYLIESTFSVLGSHTYDPEYMIDRAILTPLNDEVKKLNPKVIKVFPSQEQTTYYSIDVVPKDMNNLYLPDFLSSLSPGNLHPHKLILKKGAPIMLLRNIDPKIELCNGTRLIYRRFGRNVIDAEVLTGEILATRVFLPHIPLKTSEDAKLPFEIIRRYFHVRLSFALTINKFRRQTIPNVGIYFPDHVFSHDQFCVTSSWGVSERTTKVLMCIESIPKISNAISTWIMIKSFKKT